MYNFERVVGWGDKGTIKTEPKNTACKAIFRVTFSMFKCQCHRLLAWFSLSPCRQPHNRSLRLAKRDGKGGGGGGVVEGGPGGGGD